MRCRSGATRERATALPLVADFEEAILPQLDAAYNLARWLVRDERLAEDVVQDASVRAFSCFVSHKGGDGRASLFRIGVYNVLAARTSANDAGFVRDIAPQVADARADLKRCFP